MLLEQGPCNLLHVPPAQQTGSRIRQRARNSEFTWRQESVCYLVFFVSWLASLLVLLHAQHRRPLEVLAGPWPMDALWELLLGIILANPCGYNVSLAVKSILQLLQHWPCFYHPLQWPLDVAGCNGRFPGAWPDLSESGNVTAQPFFKAFGLRLPTLDLSGWVFLWSLSVKSFSFMSWSQELFLVCAYTHVVLAQCDFCPVLWMSIKGYVSAAPCCLGRRSSPSGAHMHGCKEFETSVRLFLSLKLVLHKVLPK